MGSFSIDGLIQIRTGFVNFYLLHDEQGACLIDSGFIFGRQMLRRALQHAGLSLDDIRCVLLTHGHLDHATNLAWLKENTGARVYGFAQERPHLRGTYPYRGAARFCGWLEAAGRALVSYVPADIDEELTDGQVIDTWGGMRAVHLPGHTAGHAGYYSERTGLLFAGDLFVNRTSWTKYAPFVLNSCPERLPGSIEKVFALEPAGILCNHCDRAGPEKQLRRFRKKFRRSARNR